MLGSIKTDNIILTWVLILQKKHVGRWGHYKLTK